MASGIPLAGLPVGVEWDENADFGITLGVGELVYVYFRDSVDPVTVFSDQALSQPLTQPLSTNTDGTIPGYIAAEQAIDIVDSASGDRVQAEPLAVADLIGSDGRIGGPGSLGLSGGGSGGSGSTTGLNFRGFWAPGTQYVIDDFVQYGGTAWVCTSPHTATGSFDDTKFDELDSWRGPFLPNTRYEGGDVVIEAGTLYQAPVSFTSASIFTPSNWNQIAGGSGGGGATPPTAPTPQLGTANLQIANTQFVAELLALALAGAATPVNLGQPQLTGSPVVMDVITCSSPGYWTGAPSTFAYEIQSSTSPTTGFTNVSANQGYTIAGGDLGKYFRVAVTPPNAAGPAYSNVLGPVTGAGASAPVNSGAPPSITGSAMVGGLLTANTGGWTAATGTISYSFQWAYISGALISGATGPTYSPQQADAGKQITVQVTASTASSGGGTAAAVTSAPTGAIASYLLSAPVVTVSG
jgi:hypothetical protein